MLDLRVPCGLFFFVTGAILAGMGVWSPNARPKLSDANVDLYSGIVMLLFGAFLLALAFRARRNAAAGERTERHT